MDYFKQFYLMKKLTLLIIFSTLINKVTLNINLEKE